MTGAATLPTRLRSACYTHEPSHRSSLREVPVVLQNGLLSAVASPPCKTRSQDQTRGWGDVSPLTYPGPVGIMSGGIPAEWGTERRDAVDTFLMGRALGRRRGIGRRELLALALLVGLLALAACGETSAPSSATLLKDAQTKLNATQSFHFQMKVDHPGTPSNGGYVITSAQGDVSRPASLSATATVDAGIVDVNVSLIIIGQQEWYTDPISQTFVSTSQFGYFLNIFDSQHGLGALMSQLQSPSAPADGSANGQSCWKISGSLSPSLLQPLFNDVVATQPIPTTYCIGKADGRLDSATLSGAITDGDTSQTAYTFYLSKFDVPVTITPPAGA